MEIARGQVCSVASCYFGGGLGHLLVTPLTKMLLHVDPRSLLVGGRFACVAAACRWRDLSGQRWRRRGCWGWGRDWRAGHVVGRYFWRCTRRRSRRGLNARGCGCCIRRMLAAICWSSLSALATRSRCGGRPGSFIRVSALVGRAGAAPRGWPKTASGFMMCWFAHSVDGQHGDVAAGNVIDGRFDPGRCDRQGGSIWVVAIVKGLTEGPTLPIVNGHFASVPRCAVFCAGREETNPKWRCEPEGKGRAPKEDVSRRSAKRS